MSIRLGSFELIEPIAKGGMGEVWLGRHPGAQLEVAVKVISADFARHPGFVASLRHEVRAMASLDHPNIVRVLDQGTVDARAAADADHRLVAGSPFIAMECVRHGTLADHLLRLPWDDVRVVLLKLLSALAHAHARDVLHRDLKPANILLTQQATGTIWDLRLTDFGIAQPLHSDVPVGPAIAGTPQFMAPEQARGDWRAYRPSTDLFAVGRIANALLARDADGHAWVPAGFETWMGHLLADLPQHRFPMAADAAWALRQLGPADTVLVDDLLLDATNRPTVVDLPPTGTAPAATGRARLGQHRPPVPESHRNHAERDAAPPLLNAGAGLLGLRTPALVGRDHEQAVLWSLLRRVHTSGRTHLAVLRGPEGIGKRALARWFQRHSYEVGAAWPQHAAFDPVADDEGPLGLLLAREFKTLGLDHDAAKPRVERLAQLYGVDDPFDVAALLEAANPKTPDVPGFRFANAADHRRLVARFLRWAARERPVLLHLEDVQWSAAALELVDLLFALDEEEPVPLLVVATVEDRALSTCVTERELLADVVRRAGRHVLELPLAPLTPSAQRSLVASLIGLDPSLVASLAEQTAGNPLHAIQRVTTLHEGGRLVPSRYGLVLADDDDETLPTDGIWQHRLLTFLAERSDNSRLSVELLAVLGRRVRHRTWVRLARRVGAAPTQHLVDSMETAGLLQVEGDVYVLTHASLRDAVLQLARQEGRLASHHLAAADVLEALGEGHEGTMGEHLLAGGRPEAALQPLHRGAEVAMGEGEVHRAAELVERWQDALQALHLTADDPRQGDSLLLQARLAIAAYETHPAREAADRLLELAERHGWGRHRAEALALQGRVAYMAGEHDRAVERFERALGTDESDLDRTLQAEILFYLARTWVHWGDVEKTTRYTAEARPLFLETGNRNGERLCLLLAASAAFQSGRPEAALALAGTAKTLAEELGTLKGQAEAIVLAGEVHRSEGRMDKALAAYQLGRRMLRSAAGTTKTLIIDLNLASTLTALARFEEALEVLDPAIARLHQVGRHGLEAVAHCLALPALAALGNRVGFERHLEAATGLLETTRFRETDAIMALEDSAVRAREAGWIDLAARASMLAITMESW